MCNRRHNSAGSSDCIHPTTRGEHMGGRGSRGEGGGGKVEGGSQGGGRDSRKASKHGRMWGRKHTGRDYRRCSGWWGERGGVRDGRGCGEG